ncbi:MAG: hypothetical protein ACHQD9_01580, partial [Chitinophagales bacterium]
MVQRVTAANNPVVTNPESSQLRFIENKNQLPSQVLFDGKIPGGNVFLEKNTFTYYVFSEEDLKRMHPLHEDSLIIHGHAWKEIFLGGNADPKITSVSPSDYYFNYFLGNDPSKWASRVHDYQQVTYTSLYPGIDMNVYGIGMNLKYDLIVSPFTDPSQIQLQFIGTDA